MKLYFSGKHYRRFDGLEFRGPGEIEVSEDIGNYLLNTFPNLFKKTETKIVDKNKMETKEKKLRKKINKK